MNMVFIGVVVLALVLFISTMFMPWRNASRMKYMQREIDLLTKDLIILKRSITTPQYSTVETEKEEDAFENHIEEKITETIDVEQTITLPPEVPYVETQKKASVLPCDTKARIKVEADIATNESLFENAFEYNFASKLPVWIGAISLIFAAFYLVKYSIALGWLGPEIRLLLSGFAGCTSIVGGVWLSKKVNIANYERISQALIGAGLVTLYVVLYAAVNRLDILPSFVGLIGMVSVTAAAVVLSLRHGQAIAVFGVIGGLLTPALLGSNTPNVPMLFTYLFLLSSGMMFLFARKGWWVLATIFLLGLFSWVGFWMLMVFAAVSAFIPLLFVSAITVVVLIATGKALSQKDIEPKTESKINALNGMAISSAVLVFIWLSFKISLTLFDWSMLILPSLALMSLTHFRPEIYNRALLVKLCVSLGLFCLWSFKNDLYDILLVASGISAVYIALPYVLMRRVSNPMPYAQIQAIASITLYIICYIVLGGSDKIPSWFEAGGWGVIALICAALALHQIRDIKKNYKADDTVKLRVISAYSVALTGFISLSFVAELPIKYLTVAFAAQIFATSWLYKKYNFSYLLKIILALTAIFVFVNLDKIYLFAHIAGNGLMNNGFNISRFLPLTNNMNFIPLMGSLPLLMGAYKWMFNDESKKYKRLLSGIIASITLMLVYYLVKVTVNGGQGITNVSSSFIERGLITNIFGIMGFVMLSLSKRTGDSNLNFWGIIILHLSIFRIIYFDIFMHNPYWDRSQMVGVWPLLNGVTLTYGGAICITGWAIYKKHFEAFSSPWKNIYKVVILCALFLFSTYTVRHFFHGSQLFAQKASNMEFYMYSVAWLLTGVSLLTVGIWRDSQPARMASILFIGITVLKVFLFDAAELEGLYRVFSFLGLGASLIGLSYFYTKFVFKQNTNLKNK